jgi:hypothetical protein
MIIHDYFNEYLAFEPLFFLKKITKQARKNQYTNSLVLYRGWASDSFDLSTKNKKSR